MSQAIYKSIEGPLSPDQLEALAVLGESLSPGQTLWAARWLMDRFDVVALGQDILALGCVEAATSEEGQHGASLTVLYGSHSGHCASIAKDFAAKARDKGWSITLANMADYAKGNLRREKNLVIVVSTHGEGEPPESIRPFFSFLCSDRAPRLDGTAFAVLGLGDKTYKHFCKTGRDVDARLTELGATRLLEREDLDVDYQDGAERWVGQALDVFAPRLAAARSSASGLDGRETTGSVGAASGLAPSRLTIAPRDESGRILARPLHRYDRETPWMAEVLERVGVSGRESTQRFVHIELSLAGSRIHYLPGDSLGLRPLNDPALVARIVKELGASPDFVVQVAGQSTTLLDALTRRLEIRIPTPSGLRKYAASGAPGLDEILQSPERTAAYLGEREWPDVLHEYPCGISAFDFVALLPELGSRSYSIASAPSVYPEEVHLLVSCVQYQNDGHPRKGVATGYLADRVAVGDKIPVWVEPNPRFRLPKDASAPVVMIGAGTGIAPFRAFLQERAAGRMPAKSWIVFGNRRFRDDFTYQSEWLQWREQQVLTRMDVAFSRDQDQRIYVTDKLREHGKALHDWLLEGAHVYLCGDRRKLSDSVDQALIDVVARHGGRSHEQAKTFVDQLQQDGRYRKDVYG